jgi:hypothetical protein
MSELKRRPPKDKDCHNNFWHRTGFEIVICHGKWGALPFRMAIPTILPCDGCGQLASGEHIARRLERLEWATRFRPIHMQALLLAAVAPEADDEFLYAPETRFAGLAGEILWAAEIPANDRLHEEVLTEFQKRGLYLAYALECALEAGADASFAKELLERHLASVMARIRRSLKPKRVLLVSQELQAFLPQIAESSGCPVVYAPIAETAAFRAALPGLAAHLT